MKITKTILRYWFAIASVFTFLGGWIILAHSPKPIQPSGSSNQNSLVPIPTLPPIQTFGNNNNGGSGFGIFSQGPSTNTQPIQGFPRMRTGGS